MAPRDNFPEAPPLRVEVDSLQALAQSGRWEMEAIRSLSSHVLLWITRGQGRWTIEGVTRGYGPQTAIFVPAGRFFEVEIGQRVQGQALFLPRADGLGMPDQVQQLRISAPADQVELTHLIEMVQNEAEHRAPGRDRALAAWVTLLSVWLMRRQHLNERAADAPPRRPAQLLDAFAALVAEEIDAGRSVAWYARRLGVTPTHLSRVCREALGKPASEVLQDRLLFEARRLLAESDMKVQDIAARLGFSSAAYFTRVFTQHAGFSPTAYRRRARGEQA